ncbi:DUF5689 domain-containing protein [Mucilaginibacter myungsuensis]|uniref:DUF5689 domain-containing protein n=1 Tax=Mucilaginibacter myungsuensis TaxID=649104 RepID=A0A929PWU2_9SPHI|nr:DUF5689 domain-containing protein [Mucilaginibacter myungsuensis]MBE9661537.1 hypothetical protein [Mucilaginibacter myungsuensis]MDN3597680.1 DUF5689 domain-containing protein [Mucilaginibacter myungsuensis]
MKKILAAFFIAITGISALNSCKKDTNRALGTINPYASLYVVKMVYQGSDVTIDADALNGAVKTGGVVISNNAGTNFPTGGIVMQNTTRGFTRGIIIDVADAATYAVGDSINVDVAGATIKKVGSSLHLSGVGAITKISTGKVITPRTVALGDLVTNFANYESTLVKVTADTKPLPALNEKYVGAKTLNDGGTNDLVMYTQTTAAFANTNLPASASYTAIPTYGSTTDAYGNAPQIRIRTIADVENASGPIYAGFPESFETPDAATKASYNMNTATVPDNTITLKTGSWKLEQAILGNLNANRDRYNAPGVQCIRIQQSLSVPGYVEMKFDLPNGASKLTLWQGAYSTDVSSTFKLQYSINGGTAWVDAIAVGRTTANIATQTGGSRQETYLFNLTGNVRFRVMKLGLGTTSVPNVLNGRLCIEDIAIFSN